MIIVDTALQERHEQGNPIRVGLIGAGYIGRGIVLQIARSFPGMETVAVYNRTLSRAGRAYEEAGIDTHDVVTTVAELDAAIDRGRPAVTDDPMLLCRAEGIDVIVEATGTIEFAASVALEAIRNGKHVVVQNAELDATIGPILKVHADREGVVFTSGDGDQPGVAMNLFRYVKQIGYNPVLIGNIKGLLDHYRTPETQRAFAEKAKQDVKMVTSFADGTKLSMEQVVMANATGFGVSKRGMHGPECDHVTEAVDLFSRDELLDGGRTDFILGAEPGPGVFVIGYNDHPTQQHYANVLKMGEGPLYTFYIPYHLPHLETPLSVARAELFQDPTITPQGAPVCEVATLAKRDLQAGETLDGIGGFLSYGAIDNVDVIRRDNLMPMGVSEGATLVRDIPQDQAIRFDDVEMPTSGLAHRLYHEQLDYFFDDVHEASLVASETT
ncbi:MAG: Gfo/Idh/MocA family oxidoreductase [Salinibacter sp.]